MSIVRADISLSVVSNLINSSGYRGVKLSNKTKALESSGLCPLIVSTLKSAKNLSLSFGGRICPAIICPVFNLNLLIWECET